MIHVEKQHRLAGAACDFEGIDGVQVPLARRKRPARIHLQQRALAVFRADLGSRSDAALPLDAGRVAAGTAKRLEEGGLSRGEADFHSRRAGQAETGRRPRLRTVTTGRGERGQEQESALAGRQSHRV